MEPSLENRRRKGSQYERLAARFLMQQGVRILDFNFHDGKKGEIDIIGDDNGTLIFVEVKYRSSHSAGYAEEAVTWTKRKTICQTARYYLCRHGIGDTRPMRFDVIAINGTSVEGQVHVRWIRNAFEMQ